MRTDDVVDAFPVTELAVELFHFQRAGGDLVKLFGVGPVGAFDGVVFPNPRLCKALLDRITDRAHIIETGTESYRFRRTLEVRQKKKAS